MSNRNHEVTTPQSLLNKQGNIAEPGWARSQVQAYHRADITAPKFRIKEWDYYLVLNRDFAVCFTVSDLGYMGMLSASFLDFTVPCEQTETVLTPFPMGKFGMPESSDKGDVVYDRVFNAAFNMKKLIEASGVMTRVNDYSELYNLKRFSCDFYMNNTLEIFREMVKTDNESGFEIWNEEDCGDDKGMNQEI